MAGKMNTGFDQTADPALARAFCEGRQFHAGDGITNPITGHPYTAGQDDEFIVAWQAGWTSRDNGEAALTTSCAE